MKLFDMLSLLPEFRVFTFEMFLLCVTDPLVAFISVQKAIEKRVYTEKSFLTFFLYKYTKQWRMKICVCFPRLGIK